MATRKRHVFIDDDGKSKAFMYVNQAKRHSFDHQKKVDGALGRGSVKVIPASAPRKKKAPKK